MAKIEHKIGNHNLEITYSWWINRGKIRIDGEVVFSKMMFSKHSEKIEIDNQEFLVIFGSKIFPNIKIKSKITSDSQIQKLVQ